MLVTGEYCESGVGYGGDRGDCKAISKSRGIKNSNLAEGFRISGLGQLVEAGIQADRLVVFGD